MRKRMAGERPTYPPQPALLLLGLGTVLLSAVFSQIPDPEVRECVCARPQVLEITGLQHTEVWVCYSLAGLVALPQMICVRHLFCFCKMWCWSSSPPPHRQWSIYMCRNVILYGFLLRAEWLGWGFKRCANVMITVRAAICFSQR